jgi:hypothetical protein
MLYVMAERWKPAYRYRNAFERVKEVMFDTRAQSPPAAELTAPEHDPCNVTNAVDAFFANPREVDTFLESVLNNQHQGLQDGWTGLDGSRLDAEAWIANLGNMPGPGQCDPPSWDDPATLMSA